MLFLVTLTLTTWFGAILGYLSKTHDHSMNLLDKVFVGGIGSDLTVTVTIGANKAPTFLFKFLHELNEPLIFNPVI